jgi:hypothetical protein
VTYTTADIIALHLYHCIDCLVDGLHDGAVDCGCVDASLEEVREDYALFAGDEKLREVWAKHVAWAIKEYAEDQEQVSPA